MELVELIVLGGVIIHIFIIDIGWRGRWRGHRGHCNQRSCLACPLVLHLLARNRSIGRVDALQNSRGHIGENQRRYRAVSVHDPYPEPIDR